MEYTYTRSATKTLSFEEALFSGLAADGSLVVPKTIPQVDLKTLSKWKNLSYVEIVKQVVALYVSSEEIPRSDQEALIENAFGKLDIPEVLRKQTFGDLNIMEMWHGPTLSFKDLAMCCVGEFFNYFLSKKKKHVIVLVATSGDTGSSAIEAVRGKDSIDIIVILPHNKISKVQELMMTTVLESNVHVYAGEGFSDEFDIVLKKLFSDGDFASKNNLCSINSINWCRVMVQIAHHIFMYLQITKEIGEPVDIVVPTGGCGNIASGMFAQEMGVPVKFVCAVNQNDIVHRAISKNDFSLAETVQTIASAMDIQLPPNFERVIWTASKGNSQLVRKVMEEFEKEGKATMPDDLHNKIKRRIRTAVVGHNEIVKAMKKCYADNKYIACPHTCTAMAYHYGFSEYGCRKTTGTRRADNSLVPDVCIATASAAKFPEVVEKAGLKPDEPPESVKALFKKASRYCLLRKGDDWEVIIRDKIISIKHNR